MMAVVSINKKTTKEIICSVARLEKEIPRKDKYILEQKSDVLMNDSQKMIVQK